LLSSPERKVVFLMSKALAVGLVGLFVLVAPAAWSMEGLVLRDMDGRPVPIDSMLAEGPVVLNFWATWCRPCRVEMPKLQGIEEELRGQAVHFAAVSLDTRRHKSKVEAFIEGNGVTLPVYRDPEGSLARKFKVSAIPTTILLDQDAEIAFRTRGYRPGDEVLLKKEIEALLKERGRDDKLEEASQ
jgi:thiol-disulfide isomerase/thioredoxin